MLYYFDALGQQNWATSIKNILNDNGFGFIWEQQKISNEKVFLREFEQILRDKVGKKAGNTRISQDGGKYWSFPGNTGNSRELLGNMSLSNQKILNYNIIPGIIILVRQKSNKQPFI